MNRKFACILLMMLLSILPLHSMSEAQTSSEIVISGDAAKDTVVAGVFHNITLNLDQASDHVTLRAFLSGGFETGNSTNNYSWSYSSGVWADDLYDYYIDDECAIYGNLYCFSIALDSQAITGTWQLMALVDGTEVATRQITVETPVAGISMSAPTFYFHVTPYGTGLVSSWNPDNASHSEHLTTRNIGNVPLTLSITFEGVGDVVTSSSFGSTNTTGIFPPDGQREHYIDFQAQSWSPRKFTVKGYVTGEQQVLMTPGTVSTIIAPRTTFDIVITVARPGYDVYQMDGVAVQYKSFYYSAYRQTISMDMYLTGNKSVYLNQEMQNLTFNFFHHGVNDYEEAILLELTENNEQHILVNLTCSSQPPWKQPSMIAYAHFDLRLADDSGTGRFTSNVVVKASADSESDNPISASTLVIIILIIVFLVIGIVLFRVYRKTEGERRRELEDRIRKKKEQAKKQRRR